MSYVKRISVVCALALLVFVSRSARADELDQSMVVTFSGPVEIPGAVLPAGTYEFRLANPTTDRSLVEVLSADGTRSYALLFTNATARTNPTDEPVVNLEERAAGSPEAIRSIFYPGNTTGMAFVYPTDRKDGGARRAEHTAGAGLVRLDSRDCVSAILE
jgi:hypothetical protein